MTTLPTETIITGMHLNRASQHSFSGSPSCSLINIEEPRENQNLRWTLPFRRPSGSYSGSYQDDRTRQFPHSFDAESRRPSDYESMLAVGGHQSGSGLAISFIARGNFEPPPHVPFLSWRLDWNDDERTKVERDQTLAQLLNRVHGSIAFDFCGEVYRETLQCTAHSQERVLALVSHSSSLIWDESGAAHGRFNMEHHPQDFERANSNEEAASRETHFPNAQPKALSSPEGMWGPEDRSSDDTIVLVVQRFLGAVRMMREKTQDIHYSVSGIAEGNGDANLGPHL